MDSNIEIVLSSGLWTATDSSLRDNQQYLHLHQSEERVWHMLCSLFDNLLIRKAYIFTNISLLTILTEGCLDAIIEKRYDKIFYPDSMRKDPEMPLLSCLQSMFHETPHFCRVVAIVQRRIIRTIT